MAPAAIVSASCSTYDEAKKVPGGTPLPTSFGRDESPYLLSLPTLTRLTPSKVVFPALSGGVLLRAMMPVSLG